MQDLTNTEECLEGDSTPVGRSGPSPRSRLYGAVRWMSARVGLGIIVGSILSAVALSAVASAASPYTSDDFEGADCTWTVVESDAPYRVDRHLRSVEEAHSGNASEQWRITAGVGTAIYLRTPVAPAHVIDELIPSIWIRANRTGLQLIARVVLPQQIDPDTEQPVVLRIRGESYDKPGAWQQLHVSDIPRHVSRQARVLRLSYGQDVNESGAYVEALELNAYGGKGATELWIDDLSLRGFVPCLGVKTPTIQRVAYAGDVEQRPVELTGAHLLVGGRPFFPVIVSWHGERLEYLKQLGFNGVWLNEPPSPALCEEARTTGMWLIAPPPESSPPESEAESRSEAEIGAEYSAVLAWHMGEGVSREDLPRVQAATESLRRRDRKARRPILVAPSTDWRGYSRHADVILAGRSVAGTSLSLREYVAWFKDRAQTVRLGTPLWARVDTALDARLVSQLAGLVDDTGPTMIARDTIIAQAEAALSAGSRGLVFRTPARLDDENPLAQQLAASLELFNYTHRLLEPFWAGGRSLESVTANVPDVVAAYIQIDRARLLSPLWSGAGAQLLPGLTPPGGVTMTVPAPETHKAFEITPAGVRALKTARVNGGTRFTIRDFDVHTSLLMAQDPQIVATISRRSAESAERAASLERTLASARLDRAGDREAELSDLAEEIPLARQWLAAAKASLARSEQSFSSRRFAQSWAESRAASKAVRALERARWEQALSRGANPAALPTLGTLDALPAHYRLLRDLQGARYSANRLAGGDCEDVTRMRDAGWKHVRHPLPNIRSAVSLSQDDPHAGRGCLRIAAWCEEGDSRVSIVETPPVWITGMGISAEAGSWWRIRAHVRVPQPLGGSVDGLLMFDSWTGPELGARVTHTRDWEAITLYRQAPASGDFFVTFALAGLGEAFVDNVTVEPIVFPAAEQAALPTGPPAR